MPPKRPKTSQNDLFAPPAGAKIDIIPAVFIAHGLRSDPYDALWPSPARGYAREVLGQTYENRVTGPRIVFLPQIRPPGGGLSALR